MNGDIYFRDRGKEGRSHNKQGYFFPAIKGFFRLACVCVYTLCPILQFIVVSEQQPLKVFGVISKGAF